MLDLAEIIWDSKYRLRESGAPVEKNIEETWRRVASAVAANESAPRKWEDFFFQELSSQRFLPGGRILAGAGADRRATLFSCFVSGQLDDSMASIFNRLRETAITMQQGGGVGCDFSHLRPSGSDAVASGGVASGPVSFMRIWDAMCETLLSTSTRRGAMIATLRCDHPDIETFIDCKLKGDELQNFNLSVLVSDAFMQAVDQDHNWALQFPPPDKGESNSRQSVWRTIPARDLWCRITTAAAESAEPGVLFIDQINRENNLAYREWITATNPCGEIPLPPNGACDLGSINLVRFVCNPFTDQASLDEAGIRETVAIAVRFLDNVIDVSRFPLQSQSEQSRSTRRIGLGITGLADLFLMMGAHYDSDQARQLGARLMRLVRDSAYEASVAIASEKGAFPVYDRPKYLASPFIARLDRDLRAAIEEQGIRNSHLLAIAPAGSISLLAGNVSSGIEPVFSFDGFRTVRTGANQVQRVKVQDYAYSRWLNEGGQSGQHPDNFVTARELSPHAHLAMQARLQPLVDSAISKTVNLPKKAAAKDVARLYSEAFQLGLKGCTVFREGSLSAAVLHKVNA
jgi:ribonucleoside-diphosphate reductase alpha chain